MSHHALAGAIAAASLTTVALAGVERPAILGPEDVPLIPREVLFGNPERAGLELSPDGRHVSYLAPVDGVLNVWVAPVDDLDAAWVVTSDADRGIRQYFWAENSENVIYLQDRGGDENWRAYSVHVTSREEIDLTPMDGVQARITATDRDDPDHILISVNDRSPQFHDTYRVNVRTGERELVHENDGYVGTVVDNDMQVRMGVRMNADASMVYEVIGGPNAGAEVLAVPQVDSMTTGLAGFIGDSSTVYMLDSRDRDTGALYKLDLETGARELLFADDRADVQSAVTNPITDELEAIIVNYDRPKPVFFDDAFEEDWKILEQVRDGDVSITSRSHDDRTWLVAYLEDDGPVAYYHYDRDAKNARYLFTNRPALEELPLAPMHPVIIEARDGLDLVSYLSLPTWTDADGDGRPSAAVPLVLFVHGGPWARDNWGYHSYHQWLANRGYAVLSVNFRGSTGFGKSFIAAGNGQWADDMHTDLVDAVQWAIDEGIADPEKVAIMGGSYGGYATLAGLVYAPELFACGVDIVGPSNLITLLEAIPSYWEPIIGMFTTRVADHRTPAGRRKLRDMSPLTHVDEIVRPLLIGQGRNDPRVNIAESNQIVDAMDRRGIPVTYVVFPDEGHGFAKPENNKAFNAVTEVFLAEHLGGRVEPIGDALEISTAQVRSFGDLDLPVDLYVPAAGEDEDTPIEEMAAVSYDDLTEEQQASVDQAVEQLESVPAEMLPMVLGQLEQQQSMVPEDQLPVLLYLKGVVEAKIAESGGS